MARDERWALAFGFQVSEFNLRFRISIPRKGAKGARVVISTEGEICLRTLAFAWDDGPCPVT